MIFFFVHCESIPRTSFVWLWTIWISCAVPLTCRLFVCFYSTVIECYSSIGTMQESIQKSMETIINETEIRKSNAKQKRCFISLMAVSQRFLSFRLTFPSLSESTILIFNSLWNEKAKIHAPAASTHDIYTKSLNGYTQSFNWMRTEYSAAFMREFFKYTQRKHSFMQFKRESASGQERASKSIASTSWQ